MTIANPTFAVYEPPISPFEKATSARSFWECGKQPLYKGVHGFAYEHNGLVYIPLIVAEKEGAGQVGEFLDRLSRRCCIIGVTSPRLEMMLRRRGFCMRMESDPTFHEPLDVWQR